jgi:hypothetical protein
MAITHARGDGRSAEGWVDHTHKVWSAANLPGVTRQIAVLAAHDVTAAVAWASGSVAGGIGMSGNPMTLIDAGAGA